MIKFGVLPQIARLSGLEFDKFATGHYANLENIEGKFYLKQAFDKTKDQSYFLYRLKQETLSKVLFPLGKYKKEEVRKIVRKYGLKIADKADSQDFYDGDYNELLQVDEKIGNIVDLEGNIIGKHKGIWNYTIGQRRGLKVSSDAPLYVLSLNEEKNEVVVGKLDKTFKKTLIVSNLNLFFEIEKPLKIKAKIRSNQVPADAIVEKISDDEIKLEFNDFQKSIAKGQSAVFYNNEIVLGGGIIKEVL